MLDGINPEVVEMLKDRVAGTVTFDVLRSMGPVRQLEAAELMLSASNFSWDIREPSLPRLSRLIWRNPNKANVLMS